MLSQIMMKGTPIPPLAAAFDRGKTALPVAKASASQPGEGEKRLPGSADFGVLQRLGPLESPQRFVSGCASLLPFEEAWESLNWPQFEGEHRETGFMSWRAVRAMTEVMAPYLLAERVPLKRIVAPILNVVDCTDPRFSSVLTGQKRSKPARLIDVSVFGFTLDVLEIRLFELESAVDLFVTLEATMTHRGVRKPLFLERARDRFARCGSLTFVFFGLFFYTCWKSRFLPKMLHLIDDDEVLFRLGVDEKHVSGVGKAYVNNW